LPDDSIVPALIQIRDRLMEQDRVMEQLHQQDQANESMTQAMNQLREQLRVVEDGVVNPVQYRNRLNNPNENMTGNTPDQKSTATETPSNDVTIVPGNSNVNHNQHQQRYQYTMTPQVTKVITATATIEELGVDPKTTVGSNGNQYGDGDCTGSNCQGTGDCDGTGIGDQDGTNCHGSGDCDGTGNDSNTSGSQQNQSVKTEGSTTETQSVSNPHNDNGSSNGNGN
jgi:hypothetical protein